MLIVMMVMVMMVLVMVMMMVMMMCLLVLSHFSHVQLSETPWTEARQAPLSLWVLQARIPEWIAMPSSRGSSQPGDRTQVSCTACGFFTLGATREAMIG